MNDFIDLPHLPECLLGLPLETIHEIHSHTYHAIKADRQCRGEPAAPDNFERAQSIVSKWPGWKRDYVLVKPTAPAQEPSVPWENFPGYLIDHREGEIITEEGLQHALSSMLQDPLYSDTAPAQEPILPEGWRIVERQTCYALHQGNEVIALLSGPRAEDNAALLAGLLAQPSAAAPKFGEEE